MTDSISHWCYKGQHENCGMPGCTCPCHKKGQPVEPEEEMPKPILDPYSHYANKTEEAYGAFLEGKTKYFLNGLLDYRYEPLKFKLADKTYYTPDFMLIYNTHIEFHEVKGFKRDDAMVKLKVVARLFPWFKFVLITRSKDGGWKNQVVGKGPGQGA